MGVSKYKEEFKQSAVQMVTEKGKGIQLVAKELGVCVKSLRDRIQRHNKALRSDAQSTQDLETEAKRLKKELADAQETVEILKKRPLYSANAEGALYDDQTFERFVSYRRALPGA